VKLPHSLTTITFGHDYNQPLDAVSFPLSLKVIIFGNIFNQSLDKVSLPFGIQSITFGCNYKKPLNNLPNSVEKLVFRKINMDITNLPCSVTHIKILEHIAKSMEKLIKIPYGCKIIDKYDNEIQ